MSFPYSPAFFFFSSLRICTTSENPARLSFFNLQYNALKNSCTINYLDVSTTIFFCQYRILLYTNREGQVTLPLKRIVYQYLVKRLCY